MSCKVVNVVLALLAAKKKKKEGALHLQVALAFCSS